MKSLKEASFFNNSLMFRSSKYFTIDTYSFRPFLLRVFNMNSRANSCGSITSKGLRTIFLSRGSPGNVCQWSKVERQNACPTVCTLRSV